MTDGQPFRSVIFLSLGRIPHSRFNAIQLFFGRKANKNHKEEAVKRFVIIIDDGQIQDVLSSSREKAEIRIVDFDKKSLDQSVLAELRADYNFEDVAALADIYAWDALYHPKRVQEVFAVDQGPKMEKVDFSTS